MNFHSKIRTFLARTALGLVAAVTVSAAQAQVQQINCPLDQIRREVTTPLPNGWWNTPIVNSLRGVRIQNISGRPALICDYGAAGTIQTYAPEGFNCQAQGVGFYCEGAGPRTYSTGGLEIPQTWTADLDNGNVGGNGADIWFQAVTQSEMYITPRNGASMAVGNRQNRNYAGCAAASYSKNRVPLWDIPVGSYICVRTDQGRISQFRMNAISSGSPKTLSIGYTTWQ